MAGADSERRSPWLFSPLVDLLFIANVGWLICLIPWLVSDAGDFSLTFWQVYFVTTPHRWLTLIVVSTDPDRRAGRTSWFLGIAAMCIAVVAGTWLYTGGLGCLLVIDYLWNAWHFGSQHGGILRMYSRRAGGGTPWRETFVLRTVVVYTAVRLAGWTTGWLESSGSYATALHLLDATMIAALVFQLVVEILDNPWNKRAKLAYLTSVSGLYLSLLLAAVFAVPWLVISLTVGAALFHAVEYIAIVTFYAKRREQHGSTAVIQTLSKQWIQLLVMYLVSLGALSAVLQLNAGDIWMAINVSVAFMHYAFDGLIWKLRRPETAQVLNVEISGEAKYA